MARPFQFDDWEDEDAGERPTACLVCEAMCPDAVDGTLSDAERRAFDKHVASCAHCTQELEDAQRGAAWLGMLKSKSPEPPSTLLARILAETTGAAIESPVSAAPVAESRAPKVAEVAEPIRPAAENVAPQLHLVPSFTPSIAPNQAAETPAYERKPGSQGKPESRLEKVPQLAPTPQGKVLPFGRRLQTWISERGVSVLHPRLAMTAAMAFFSIALTLNLTGVRLSDLRAENFRPSALQRTAVDAEATAVRSFQNLRVVYQVESRVSELRQDPLWTDRAQPDSKTNSAQPGQASDAQATDRGRN